jgi:hypothetical protein
MDINPTMVLQGIATIFFCMLIAFFLSQIMLFPKEAKDRKLRTFNVEYIENGRTYYIFDVIAYDWMEACEIVCEKNNLQVDQLVQVSVRIGINSGVSSYRTLNVDFSKLEEKVEFVWKCRDCKSEYPEDKKDLPGYINPSGIKGVICLCGGMLDLHPKAKLVIK